MFTWGISGDVFVGSLLASFKVLSGRSVSPLGALSSGAMCLVVSLILRGVGSVVLAGLLLGGGFVLGLAFPELFVRKS